MTQSKRKQKQAERTGPAKGESMVMPPLVLTMICLVVTGILVLTYQFTLPYIAEAKVIAADRSRSEVFTAADQFELYATDFSNGVSEVYLASANGEVVGLVITSASRGFDGPVTVMSGYDLDGSLVGVKITDHSETPGLGTKVAAADYLAQYQGKNHADYAEVDAISGATVTSTALKGALELAFTAYESVMEEVSQ